MTDFRLSHRAFKKASFPVDTKITGYHTFQILHHPVVVTFIQQRWINSKSIFLASFFLYLLFLILFSTFLGMMYLRESKPFIRAATMASNCSPQPNNPLVAAATALAGSGSKGGRLSFSSAVQAIRMSRISTRQQHNKKAFSGCTLAAGFSDIPLCCVEAMLTASIAIQLVQEGWECLALGLRYFRELENWCNLLVYTFTITSLTFEANIEVHKIVASFGICLAWLELIFMLGRYPSLGGRFSIMFYSITKRIVQSALAFLIMVIAFGFAFFIINFGNEGEQFQNPGKALLKIFVMVLGEFEFDNLYDKTDSSSTTTLVFTMLLLIGTV
jgi:Polycystin cation channel